MVISSHNRLYESVRGACSVVMMGFVISTRSYPMLSGKGKAERGMPIDRPTMY